MFPNTPSKGTLLPSRWPNDANRSRGIGKLKASLHSSVAKPAAYDPGHEPSKASKAQGILGRMESLGLVRWSTCAVKGPLFQQVEVLSR